MVMFDDFHWTLCDTQLMHLPAPTFLSPRCCETILGLLKATLEALLYWQICGGFMVIVSVVFQLSLQKEPGILLMHKRQYYHPPQLMSPISQK